jgi:putative protein-disulfide isomerase
MKILRYSADGASSCALYYVGDPMCSWCWGFAPVLAQVEENLVDRMELRYVMGGLARDSDEPMPNEMQQYIRHHWESVAARTGAQFNWDFWTQNQPRRSTYPACRAVLAAALQDAGPQMFHAIQHAYYLQARNPSLLPTLVELAGELSLDSESFARDIVSPGIEEQLQEDFNLRRRLQATAFPSLILEKNTTCSWIARGYEDAAAVLERLRTNIK